MFANWQEKIAPAHTALLVVDVQNDFCAPGGYMHREGHSLEMVENAVPVLRQLVDSARDVSVPIIFFQANYATPSNWYLSPAWLDRASRANRAGGHVHYGVCEEGTWGFDFFGGIGPSGKENEIVIKKHRYSGFVGTELDLILRSKGIKTVIVTGVATNVCVESTARDAFMRDYFVVVPSDCCAAYSDEEQRATMANISQYFGQVVPVRAIIDAWEERGRRDEVA